MRTIYNKARLVDFRITGTQDSEGQAVIKLQPKHILLECFVDALQVPYFKERIKSNTKDKILKVGFKLVHYGLEKVAINKKLFTKNTILNNNYLIVGKVSKSSGSNIIIDCGFYLSTTTQFENVKLKKGEWVKANGRLDAYLVGQSAGSWKRKSE